MKFCMNVRNLSAGTDPLFFSNLDVLHRLGNKAFAAKEYDEAIKHYTHAISIDSKNCVYYSNRR